MVYCDETVITVVDQSNKSTATAAATTTNNNNRKNGRSRNTKALNGEGDHTSDSSNLSTMINFTGYVELG